MPEQIYLHGYNNVIMVGFLVSTLLLGLPTVYYCGAYTFMRSQRRRYQLAAVVGLIGLTSAVSTIAIVTPANLGEAMHHEIYEYYFAGYMFNGFVWLMLCSPIITLVIMACVFAWPSKHVQRDMYGQVYYVKSRRARRREERISERNARFKVPVI